MRNAKRGSRTPGTKAADDEVLRIEDLAPPQDVVGGTRRIVFGEPVATIAPETTGPEAGRKPF